jgi:hypothetical protein
MSERVISDPTVAGWELNPDTGYWMWAAGSEGGGSIQDGDTEGQITTWDGDEWTPEGAVVVDASGNVDIGEKIRLLANGRLYFNSTDGFSPFIREDTNDLAVWSGAAEVLRVGADGSVNITGKLFINGQEVTAGGGGGGGFWVEESPGVIKYTGTAKATDLVAG